MEETPLLLTGTLPVIPVADRFYGTLYHDGQRPRVTALVYRQVQDEKQQVPSLLLFSLAASPTSGHAAMAQIADNRAVLFEPDKKMDWSGRPRAFSRLKSPYKEIVKSLPNLVEQHFLMFPMTLHLEDLLMHPPELARDSTVLSEREIPELPELADVGASNPSTEQEESPVHPNLPLIMPDRYLLGNYDEPTPSRHAFEGHLQALRLPFLPEWVDHLWTIGIEGGVITPLDALGVHAWIISGNIVLWTGLISRSVTDGDLRWN